MLKSVCAQASDIKHHRYPPAELITEKVGWLSLFLWSVASHTSLQETAVHYRVQKQRRSAHQRKDLRLAAAWLPFNWCFIIFIIFFTWAPKSVQYVKSPSIQLELLVLLEDTPVSHCIAPMFFLGSNLCASWEAKCLSASDNSAKCPYESLSTSLSWKIWFAILLVFDAHK